MKPTTAVTLRQRPDASLDLHLTRVHSTSTRSESMGRALRRMPFHAATLALCLLAAYGLHASTALAAGDANTAACPNESLVGFEPYLADCRAYERVSPAFKAGGPLFLNGIEADGSRMVLDSTSAFAGQEGSSLFHTSYELVRSGSGWTVAALDPPSSLYPMQLPVDVSADFTRTVWKVRTPSQSLSAEDLVVREPNGEFVPIGPMVSPAAAAGPPAGEETGFLWVSQMHYTASTPDLSRVFFEIKNSAPKWPGDTTATAGGFSSYEYVGRGNQEPWLMGQDEEGHAISDCAIGLGGNDASGEGEGRDVYNAVSADGETVYFMATGHHANGNCAGTPHAPEFNELYAQIGQPPVTQNVAISEPSAADCAACRTTVQASAEFQGASQDGKRVFFLTEQELFEGATGMNLYEYDFNNPEHEKVLRVSVGSPNPRVLGVSRVSEDGTRVYFVAQSRLTEEPREGIGGACMTALTPAERAEEEAPRSEAEEEATPKTAKCKAKAGADNLYVFERDPGHPAGRVAFIASLADADSARQQGDWAVPDNRPVQATPDGRFLVFESSADLTPGDASTVTQVFEYDAVREELVRVSVGEPGYAEGLQSADEHESTIPIQRYVETITAATPSTGLAVSADGSVVVFESAGGLTAQTAAAGSSVFEYRSAGVLSAGRVFSVSNGSSAFGASLMGTDLSGGDVFFETLAPVLESDGDTAKDAYDARSVGGFPQSGGPACAGEACQGALGAPPLFAAPGSASPNGSGNLIPPLASAPPGKPQTAAQRLARALKACRAKHDRRKRAACERQARRRYSPVRPKAKRTAHLGTSGGVAHV